MPKELKKPEDVANEWLELKEQKILVEKRIADLRPILEAYLLEKQDREDEICGHRFKLTEVKSQYFDLARAKKNKAIAKVLKPYMENRVSTRLTAAFCGEEDDTEPT